jgi:hypothetical protein
MSRTSCAKPWAWTIDAPRRTLCRETLTSLQLCCPLRPKHHCRRSHRPCQTVCSAYGRGMKHTTQYRKFCADSPRRQDDGDTDQIALGGSSAVWHVLITRRRRRNTRVFLPPLLACPCVRKSGCWRLESAQAQYAGLSPTFASLRVCASRGVGGSSLQSPGPMCVRLLVCCRLPRRDAERPGAAWQRPTTVSSVACFTLLALYSAPERPNNSLGCGQGRLERQLSFG